MWHERFTWPVAPFPRLGLLSCGENTEKSVTHFLASNLTRTPSSPLSKSFLVLGLSSHHPQRPFVHSTCFRCPPGLPFHSPQTSLLLLWQNKKSVHTGGCAVGAFVMSPGLLRALGPSLTFSPHLQPPGPPPQPASMVLAVG